MGDSSDDKGGGLQIALDGPRIPQEILEEILHSGSGSRTFLALQAHPEGLTMEEIADITGLSEETIKRGSARHLFNLQVLERSGETRDKRVYKLKRAPPVDLDCKSGSVGGVSR